jgi:uncharacterized protein (UPF0548 family)
MDACSHASRYPLMPRRARALVPGDDGLVPVTVMSAAQADRLREADLTYPEAGATAGGLPPGYHHLHRTVTLGSGAEVFTAAADALAVWQVHARAGLSVAASSPAAEQGSVLVLGLSLAAVRVGAPCRVVYVIDEPARRGFAYGTLPGHPERGEEAFIICQDQDAAVTFTVTAFSRPASPLARAAGPLGQLVQRHITSRYLRALTQ